MAANTLWSLLLKLEADSAGMRRDLAQVESQMGSLERSVGRHTAGINAGLGQMARGAGQVASGLDRLGTRAALAAAGGLAAVVTTAASFEQAWAGVRKTVEGTDAQLAALNEQFRDLSRTTPVSFETLAGIGEAGGALGIAREDLLGFTDIIARLSVSTNLTADAAATAFGQLANVLDMSSADMRGFADSLVALGNEGASTEAQIVEMAARFGAAGRLAGLTNQEILALSSTVASMGIEVEAGGSSLSRLFNATALNIGTASDEAVAFADAVGMSLGELRTAWEQDAGGVFVELLEHVRELDQFEATALLERLGITNVRDINAIMLLAEGVDEYARQLEVAEGATGALNTESDAFFNTTAGKWETFKNNVRLAADVVGQELLPIANEAMDDFVGWLTLPETQTGLRDFAKDLATGVRGLADALKTADWSSLIGGMQVAADTAKTAFDLFNRLPEPVKQLAIAALVANKVSGGAVFDIAKGLANILGGALKTIHAAHVTVIGAGGGVPGAPGAPGGGGGGLMANAAKWVLGPLAAAFAGFEIGNWMNEEGILGQPNIGAMREGTINTIELELAGADTVAELQKIHDAITGGLSADDIGQSVALALDLNGVRSSLEEQQAIVAALLAAKLDAVAAQEAYTTSAINNATPWAVRNAETGAGVLSTLTAAEQAAATSWETQRAQQTVSNGYLALINSAADRDFAEQLQVRAAMSGIHVNAVELVARHGTQVGLLTLINAEMARMHATLAAKNFAPTVYAQMQATGQTMGAGGAGLLGGTRVAYQHGAWNVPATGMALIHQGEMVIPRYEAEAIRGGDGEPAGGDTFIVNVDGLARAETPEDIAMQMRRLARLGRS